MRKNSSYLMPCSMSDKSEKPAPTHLQTKRLLYSYTDNFQMYRPSEPYKDMATQDNQTPFQCHKIAGHR